MRIRNFTIVSALMVILAVSMLSWKDIKPGPDIPDEVLKLFGNSCFDCHTAGEKSQDALKAINFDEWNEYKSTKKVGILNKIQEVIGEGKMPPKKYLDRNPEKSLSEEDRNTILTWTKEETGKLLK
ncbi:heme-binding domain-containing protein [Bacteroidota bacterium]